MTVMKFGGSSVANAERLRHVEKIVHDRLDLQPVLVLSAMGDTTDDLLESAEAALIDGPLTVGRSLEKITETHLAALQELHLAKSVPAELKPLLEELGSLLAGISLIKELTGKTRDFLVSFGERLSVRVAAMYFSAMGIKAQAIDAWDAGFFSDSNWTNAEILEECWQTIPQKVLPLVEKGIVPVITGFIAKDHNGNITTLGRGGSDLSAAMIASACKAAELQVWKDVDGILSADPRIVPDARPVPAISYDEAAELAYYGAQVLHPRAMLPCSKTGTVVRVKNSYNVDAPGSTISGSGAANSKASVGATPVRAITTKAGVMLVDIVSSRMVGQYGFLAEVFAIFARHRVSIDMVATSEVSVSMTLDAVYDLTEVKKELSRIANVEVKTQKAIVTMIGEVEQSPAVLERIFSVCEKAGVKIQMISQGASKVNISFIVDGNQSADIVRALHKNFFG